jgi:hypothetical protein
VIDKFSCECIVQKREQVSIAFHFCFCIKGFVLVVDEIDGIARISAGRSFGVECVVVSSLTAKNKLLLIQREKLFLNLFSLYPSGRKLL